MVDLSKLVGKTFYGICRDDDIPQLKIRDDDAFYMIDIFCFLCIKRECKLYLTNKEIFSEAEGVNLFDQKVKELFANHDFIIEDIAINSIGDCSIVLNHHLNIDIFIHSSAKNRGFWQLVQYDESNESILYKMKR